MHFIQRGGRPSRVAAGSTCQILSDILLDMPPQVRDTPALVKVTLKGVFSTGQGDLDWPVGAGTALTSRR